MRFKVSPSKRPQNIAKTGIIYVTELANIDPARVISEFTSVTAIAEPKSPRVTTHARSKNIVLLADACVKSLPINIPALTGPINKNASEDISIPFKPFKNLLT
jgi:hypothetical protein